MSVQELTRRAQEILRQARQASVRLGHGYIGTEHLLLALSLGTETVGGRLLAEAGMGPEQVLQGVEELVGFGAAGCPPCQGLTPDCCGCIALAAQEAVRQGKCQVGEPQLLLGVLEQKEGAAARLLRRAGVSTAGLERRVRCALGEGGGSPAFRPKPREGENGSRLLEQYARDLTQCAARDALDPVAGRERELERVIEILCRRTKNNPVLLGEPGVGKTALAEALAVAIAQGRVPEPLRGVRLLSLDMASVVAGTKYRGEFEERLRKLLREVQRLGNVLLFLDELHTLVGAGSAEGSIDAANLLKPALGRGELQIIGATTREEYRRFLCKDPALERRFQPVQLEPPSRAQAVDILRTLRPRYEAHHRVQLTDGALEAAVGLSIRYLPDRFLPDKAIDLMDEAAARVRIRAGQEPEEVRLPQARHRQALEELEGAVARQEFDRAARLREAAEQFQRESRTARARWLEETGDAPPRVEPEDVAGVLSTWTGLPVSALTADERTRLLRLESVLSQRVVGQQAGVAALARAIRRSRSGLQEEGRPVGSFLFAGPSGVGKTELSRALAAALFDSEEHLLRLDMSEFSEAHSVSRLIGSPPGYVGHETGGQLTEGIRKHPYSVVLFDEVEKATDAVWNLLLQLLEDGVLTDGQGKRADFRNAVLILTTNLGAEVWGKHPLGFGAPERDAAGTAVERALRQTFRPELLNRLDEVICFAPLEREQAEEIARRLVERIRLRLEERGVTLELRPTAMAVLADQCGDPEYGARPLRRYLRRELEDPTAQALLEGRLTAGDRLVLTGGEGHLVWEIVSAK